MTILNPVQGEVFSIRTFKSFEGYRWANTYEVQAKQDNATYNDLVTFAQQICNIERAPIPNAFMIYKVTISTYQPDSEPYNPSSFVTINVNIRGEANFTAQVLPLNVCTFVRKTTLLGRAGKLFFRGFLSEDDVNWGGDRFEISPRRIEQLQRVMNLLLQVGQPYFDFVLARGAPDPTNVRPVIGMSIVNRTAHKKMDNRYFDVRD